ncbi:MAG: hypothetical protein ACK5OQ_16420 [Burkholderiales bacterium]|jgi:hypothetical protein
MEKPMLERVLEHFDVYLAHHPASGVDWALKELLQLSRTYLPEITTLDEFRKSIEDQPPTPNKNVNESLWYLLGESSLFRLACEKVIEESDVQEAELARAVFMRFDVADRYGYDLASAIAEKLAFNAIHPDHKKDARLAEAAEADQGSDDLFV